jgi:hypothetical protein
MYLPNNSKKDEENIRMNILYLLKWGREKGARRCWVQEEVKEKHPAPLGLQEGVNL